MLFLILWRVELRWDKKASPLNMIGSGTCQSRWATCYKNIAFAKLFSRVHHTIYQVQAFRAMHILRDCHFCLQDNHINSGGSISFKSRKQNHTRKSAKTMAESFKKKQIELAIKAAFNAEILTLMTYYYSHLIWWSPDVFSCVIMFLILFFSEMSQKLLDGLSWRCLWCPGDKS